MAKRNNSRFVSSKSLGGRGPTYTCDSCGKRTRETGQDESSVGLCAYCFELCGLENTLADGHIDEAEYNTQLAALDRRYGRIPAEAKAEVAAVSDQEAFLAACGVLF